MSALSRYALVLAAAVVACSDPPSIPRPSGTGSAGSSQSLYSPTNVRAERVGGEAVFITWSYVYEHVGLEFLVERAPAPIGPWSVEGVTSNMNLSDVVGGYERHCYRVSARAATSSEKLDSEPSHAVCVY
jgi:hypothetical protein